MTGHMCSFISNIQINYIQIASEDKMQAIYIQSTHLHMKKQSASWSWHMSMQSASWLLHIKYISNDDT